MDDDTLNESCKKLVVEGFQHRALLGKAQQILRLHQSCGFIACRVIQGVYLFSNLLVLMEAVIMGVTIGTGIIESLVDAALWELPVSEAALHMLRLT